ncbi:PLP-dependent transferase [Glarea lozoyensis ATCC 20868]|uniref:PLP-dependent transferase n=1 Tax=Glarea lozoyensis (strain ATCC 20868 / MF5171) TaxID=1116229 RepID=S3EBW2_GLAL2|nr:PLP-dependent transferase [Glarea lozoyensis ATCC 20868]EPE35773.1 PLP-dependent transferase [Glarea lozoyensis ATCC 20868]
MDPRRPQQFYPGDPRYPPMNYNPQNPPGNYNPQAQPPMHAGNAPQGFHQMPSLGSSAAPGNPNFDFQLFPHTSDYGAPNPNQNFPLFTQTSDYGTRAIPIDPNLNVQGFPQASARGAPPTRLNAHQPSWGLPPPSSRSKATSMSDFKGDRSKPDYGLSPIEMQFLQDNRSKPDFGKSVNADQSIQGDHSIADKRTTATLMNPNQTFQDALPRFDSPTLTAPIQLNDVPQGFDQVSDQDRISRLSNYKRSLLPPFQCLPVWVRRMNGRGTEIPDELQLPDNWRESRADGVLEACRELVDQAQILESTDDWTQMTQRLQEKHPKSSVFGSRIIPKDDPYVRRCYSTNASTHRLLRDYVVLCPAGPTHYNSHLSRMKRPLVLPVSVTNSQPALMVVIFDLQAVRPAMAYWMCSGGDISDREVDCIISSCRDVRYTPQATVDGEDVIRRKLANCAKSPLGSSVQLDDVSLHPDHKQAINVLGTALRIAYPDDNDFVFFGDLGMSHTDQFQMEKIRQNSYHLEPGNNDSLSCLERALGIGTKFLALWFSFTEGPLQHAPNLHKLRELADQHRFIIICEDTVGSLVNCDLLRYADVIMVDLSKAFGGTCNVLGGSRIILNPRSSRYPQIKTALRRPARYPYSPLNSAIVARNCGDFEDRVHLASFQALRISALLYLNHRVKRVYYPFFNESRSNYDACKRETSGEPTSKWGFLLSIEFFRKQDAVKFYDCLYVAKGMWYGTNFTMACPYVLLKHFNPLSHVKPTDWALPTPNLGQRWTGAFGLSDGDFQGGAGSSGCCGFTPDMVY